MNYPEIIPSLFRKYLSNECTPEEVDVLLHFMEQREHEQVSSYLIEKQVNQPLSVAYPTDYALRYRLEQRLQNIIKDK
ncbi:hypothetical protein [Filimonas effusa]|uniref:Uncharacterized protein n=1 Tax=Filimonas effusa TaxID=2508721 RepID=A0A4Q1D9C2_9BACT|nr:hypothetical protein [Filimonas effusa]RXK85295.1 hypothetical protein ESB13_00255 [Filimonas effusa]